MGDHLRGVVHERFVPAEPHVHELPPVRPGLCDEGVHHHPVVEDRVHLPHHVVPKAQVVDDGVEARHSRTHPGGDVHAFSVGGGGLRARAVSLC